MSKLQTDIDISTLYSGYVALFHSIIALLTLKGLIKEVIDSLVIDSEKLKFVSSSTVYKDSDGDIVVAKSLMMNPTSKQISVKYHWLSQNVGKEFVIQKIESEDQKADIFTKGLQGEIFVRIRKLQCGW